MNFDKGLNLFHKGEFEQALDCFNQLIEQEQNNADLYLQRGRVLSRMGQLDLALQDFELICALEPYNTNFMSDRAVALHLLNRHQEALTEFDRAVNLDPKNPYRYSSRAFFKDRIGDLAGAVTDYEIAIELDPEDAVSMNNKGIVEEKMGYAVKSRKSFEQVDKMVGFEPAKSPSNEPAASITPKNQIKSIDKKEINFGFFIKTLSSIFWDTNARKEFGKFIKQKVSGNNPKKTK